MEWISFIIPLSSLNLFQQLFFTEKYFKSGKTTLKNISNSIAGCVIWNREVRTFHVYYHESPRSLQTCYEGKLLLNACLVLWFLGFFAFSVRADYMRFFLNSESFYRNDLVRVHYVSRVILSWVFCLGISQEFSCLCLT